MREFFYRYKKIILMSGFILVTILLGYLLYVLFFRPVPAVPVPGGTEIPAATGALPAARPGDGQTVPGPATGPDGEPRLPESGPSPVALGGLTETVAISDVPALGAALGNNGRDLRFYDKQSGKFYTIGPDGEMITLSEKTFHRVENVVWAPGADKAILEYPDGANIMYDFASGKQVTLPRQFEDFGFSPNGDRFVAKNMGPDPDNRWLVVASPDGSFVKPVENMGANAGSVYSSWSPNNQTVAMFTKGIGLDRQEVFFVGLNNENFKSAVIEGRGFQPKWSPAGDRLLYSVYSNDNDLKPRLWVVNAAGENIGANKKNLNLDTWAEKCAFYGNDTLYCAVPENLERGAGLFPELARSTRDDLYEIDAVTGRKKLIAIPDGDYTISNILISDNGYNLYFTDERTEKIYGIKLK